MQNDVDAIKKMFNNELSEPRLTGVGGDFQIRLTEAFLDEASRRRSWRSIGFDEWLRAGRWWLMKFQSGLYDGLSPTSENSVMMILPQAYADLLKASFILVDIFPEHPQRRFWTNEYLKVELLAEEVKHELAVIEKQKLQKPPLSQVIRSDLRIWAEIPPVVDLTPSTRSDAGQSQSRSWQTLEDIVLWQGFGSCIFKQTYATEIVEDCIILILTSKDFRNTRIVGQSQQGTVLLTVAIDDHLICDGLSIIPEDEFKVFRKAGEMNPGSFEYCVVNKENGEILLWR